MFEGLPAHLVAAPNTLTGVGGPRRVLRRVVIWGLWTSLSMGLFQDASLPTALARLLAACGSLLALAAPLGGTVGGPLIAALGARTLLMSALATIALGRVRLSSAAPGSYDNLESRTGS